MDSSKIATLGSPKPPTIASRRPMLTSQRSFSALSINTSTTHGDMLRRNSSATTANRHRRLQTPTSVPPLPLSASSNINMSPEELSSKIADSFQQFSSMLSQLSNNKSVSNPALAPVTPLLNNISNNHPTATINKTNITNVQNKKQQHQKPSSPPPQEVSSKIIPSPIQSNNRKVLRPASVTIDTNTTKEDQLSTTPEDIDDQLPKLKTMDDVESESDEDVNIEEYNSHAIYFENALKDTKILETAINEGDTRLRQRLISKWLTRAASIGDLDAMQKMIDSIRDIDINCADDKRLAITSLMYAAYFGHKKCLLLLLEQPGIQINQQDKKGWTALMWAINSNQAEIVQILLNHGAEKNLETRYGRTIFDYSTSTGVKQLIGSPPPTTVSNDDKKEKLKSEKDILVPESNTGETTSKSSRGSSTTGDIDYYYQTAVNGYGHFSENRGSTTNVDSHKKKQISTIATKIISPPDFSQLTKATTSPQQEQKNKETSQSNEVIAPQNEVIEEEELKRWESSIKSSNTFSWNQCLPDQMFVFSQDDLHFILDQALNIADTKSLMNKSQLSNDLWRPANIIFLSTRFAHYCSSKDLLNTLLSTVNVKLSRIIKTCSRDTHTLAYWIANICQLTSYLKKDPGLSVSTCEAQENLSALISEAYSYFVAEAQKKIEKILEPAMMDYESIHELEQVDFVDDWQRFFRRSSTNYSRKSTDTVTSVDRKLSIDSTSTTATSISLSQNNEQASSIMSPHSVTNMLTTIQSILQAYHVPPAIVIQAMAQFFHYLSCELFNRVLTYKKYICRSKALQLRMNISAMEEWVRTNQLPSSLNNTFGPLVQLLQLLQCLSQMDDIILFSSTVQTFDKLNPLQIKRCVQNYRYEVSEPHLPEAVEQLASQMVLDHHQQRLLASGNSRRNSSSSISIDSNVIQTRASMDNINSFVATVSNRGGGRPASISSLNCLLSPTTNKKRLSTEEIIILNNKTVQQLDDEDDLEISAEEEKRNSKYVLPFSIPITTALLQDWTDERHKKSKRDSIGDNSNYSDTIYQEIKLRKQEQLNLLDKIYPTIPEEWLYHLDKRLHAKWVTVRQY